jgi:adenylate cyclase
MRPFLLLILAFLPLPESVCLQAQTPRLDSMRRAYQRMPADTNRVIALFNLAAELYRRDRVEEATELVRRADTLSRRLGYRFGIGRCLRFYGHLYEEQGKRAQALEYYYRALDQFKQCNNAIGLLRVSTDIGNMYLEQKNYAQAESLYIMARDIAHRIGESASEGVNESNLGKMMVDRGMYTQGLQHLRRGLELYTSIHDTSYMAGSYHNLGAAYGYMHRWDSAHVLLATSLAMYRSIGNGSKAAELQLELSESRVMNGDIDGARRDLAAVMHYFTARNDSANIAATYQYLALVDSAEGRWKAAWHDLQMMNRIRSDLRSRDDAAAVIATQMEYGFKQKEAAAALEQARRDARAAAERENQTLVRNGLLSGSALLLFVSIVVYRQRNKVRREMHRSDALLLNILPAETAAELKATGTAQARQYENVSVLFTDVVNFTELSATMSPTVLVSQIHHNFTAIDAIIERHGLEKIKTIGDAYLAVCGLPHETADHAVRVVRAALDIAALSRDTTSFNMRIGIHSGPVVAGIVGFKKYAYDIWGDTVNTAARMESSGQAGRVNISESTYQLVRDHFRCEDRGAFEVKGKGMVRMYFVVEEEPT